MFRISTFRLSILFFLIALAFGSAAFAETCNGLSISTPSPLITGTKSEDYSTDIIACPGVSSNYVWSIVNGSLPAGLSATPGELCFLGKCITPLLHIGGVPTQGGASTFTVRLTDGATTVSKQYKLSIGVFKITTLSPLPSATRYLQYDQKISAVNGLPLTTWSIVSGNLPPGLSFRNDCFGWLPMCMPNEGEIYGTPTALGTYTFTVKIDDTALQITKQYSITVN